ncbi:hypothetical protein D3C85_1426790 [compost metagenome]
MALMRSARARDSSATSMAEPIWLEYIVRKTFGRYPSTIIVLMMPPSKNADQAMMKYRATRNPRSQANIPAAKITTVKVSAKAVARRRARA